MLKLGFIPLEAAVPAPERLCDEAHGTRDVDVAAAEQTAKPADEGNIISEANGSFVRFCRVWTRNQTQWGWGCGEKREEAWSRDKSAELRAIEDGTLKTGTKCKRTVNTVPVPLGPGQGTFRRSISSSRLLRRHHNQPGDQGSTSGEQQLRNNALKSAAS